MPYLIAHRGLTQGPDELENHPSLIEKVLKNYCCEIDLHVIDDKPWLGHDRPCYQVDRDFLLHDGLWIHCKDAEALILCQELGSQCRYFWHENDYYTITSRGIVIMHPSARWINDAVAMMPELSSWSKEDLRKAHGICSDYIMTYRRLYDSSWQPNAAC